MREARFVQQPRDLLGRMLEVVIHRDRGVVAGQAHSAQDRVVLPVVAQQVDPADPWLLGRQLFDDRPGGVLAAVVHQDGFVGWRD